MEFVNPEDLPEHIKDLIKKKQEADDWFEQGKVTIRKALIPEEEAYDGILMEIYSYFGDHAPSYRSSVASIHSTETVIKQIRKQSIKIDDNNRIQWLRMMARLVDKIADIHEVGTKAKEDHESSAPEHVAKTLKEIRQED